MALAPIRAAVSTAVVRSLNEAVFASTSKIWQFGQIAETISTSSEISCAHPASFAGNGPFELPYSLTFVKHLLTVVHADRWYAARYFAKSLIAVGSFIASTIATVCPCPPVFDGNAYAACRSAGPYAPELAMSEL